MSTYIIKKNNVITMNRGDTLIQPISLTVGKFPYEKPLEIGKNDIIFFGLMDPNQKFEHAIVKKEYTINDFDSEGNLVLYMSPDDTMGLISGVYYYALRLLKEDETITTLIPNTKFIIVD